MRSTSGLATFRVSLGLWVGPGISGSDEGTQILHTQLPPLLFLSDRGGRVLLNREPLLQQDAEPTVGLGVSAGKRGEHGAGVEPAGSHRAPYEMSTGPVDVGHDRIV